MKVFNEIPNDIWDEGVECIVWLGNDEYVYKAYKRIQTITDLLKRLEALNSLPEYETEEIYGVIPNKNIYITRLKKLKNWELIFVEYYISHHRRMRDWESIIENYLICHGYEKLENYGWKNRWKKGNITINDVEITNIGMTDDGEIKIIDARVM